MLRKVIYMSIGVVYKSIAPSQMQQHIRFIKEFKRRLFIKKITFHFLGSVINILSFEICSYNRMTIIKNSFHYSLPQISICTSNENFHKSSLKFIPNLFHCNPYTNP